MATWLDKEPPFETSETGRNELVEAAEGVYAVYKQLGNPRAWIQSRLRAAGLTEATDEFIDAARNGKQNAVEITDTAQRSFNRLIHAVANARLRDNLPTQMSLFLQLVGQARNLACTELVAEPISAEAGEMLPNVLSGSTDERVNRAEEQKTQIVKECEEYGEKLDLIVLSIRSTIDAILLMAEAAWRESRAGN